MTTTAQNVKYRRQLARLEGSRRNPDKVKMLPREQRRDPVVQGLRSRRKIMHRCFMLGVLTAAVLAFAAPAPADHTAGKKAVGGRLASDDRDGGKSHVPGWLDKCAKACAGCSLACESCFSHCAKLVGAGKKEHIPTMRLCLDCGELCATGARLSARHGALAATACEACAKGCDACAAECEKAPADDHMTACAKTCRACAVACREMIKHSQPHE